MKPFIHINAGSVEEAVELLAKYEGKAKLTQGADLLGVLKDRILPQYPETIINIKTIPGLSAIEEYEGGVSVGALTTLAEIIKSPIIEKYYPLLNEAAKTVASPQIRNMATIGGNLCQDTRCWYYRYPDKIGGMIDCFRKGGKVCPAASGENQYHAVMGAKRCFAVCPSDTAVALTALGARVSAAGPEGPRNIPVEEFYTPLGMHSAPGEMITEICIPKPSPAAGQKFLKFTLRKPIDFAVVSVAVLITLDRKICAMPACTGAVASAPVRAFKAEEYLQGKELSEENTAEAAEIALAGAKPLAKNAYKVEIAKTLVKRAVTAAVLKC